MTLKCWRILIALFVLAVLGRTAYAAAEGCGSCEKCGSCSKAADGEQLIQEAYPIEDLLHACGDCPKCPKFLLRVIPQIVAPESWCDQGGQGSIDYCEACRELVVFQSAPVQKQVADFLKTVEKMASACTLSMPVVAAESNKKAACCAGAKETRGCCGHKTSCSASTGACEKPACSSTGCKAGSACEKPACAACGACEKPTCSSSKACGACEKPACAACGACAKPTCQSTGSKACGACAGAHTCGSDQVPASKQRFRIVLDGLQYKDGDKGGLAIRHLEIDYANDEVDTDATENKPADKGAAEKADTDKDGDSLEKVWNFLQGPCRIQVKFGSDNTDDETKKCE